jgi:hydrogenase/urease accessory protein HupE
MGEIVAILNGYVHWRILRDRPITWPYVLALSLMDLAMITVGLMMTSRLDNTFFLFYYPALLGVALIFRRRISFVVAAAVAGIYTIMSVTMEPGVDT